MTIAPSISHTPLVNFLCMEIDHKPMKLSVENSIVCSKEKIYSSFLSFQFFLCVCLASEFFEVEGTCAALKHIPDHELVP